MKFNIFGYLIGEGFRNTFKNKKSTISAMLAMCISMLLFGLFFILGENVNHIMQTVEDSQAIQVFVKIDATEEQVRELGEKLKEIDAAGTARIRQGENMNITQIADVAKKYGLISLGKGIKCGGHLYGIALKAKAYVFGIPKSKTI